MFIKTFVYVAIGIILTVYMLSVQVPTAIVDFIFLGYYTNWIYISAGLLILLPIAGYTALRSSKRASSLEVRINEIAHALFWIILPIVLVVSLATLALEALISSEI